MPGERSKSHAEESCFRNAILTRVIGVKWPLSAAILVIKRNRKRIVITVNSACVVKRLYTSRHHHQQISWDINVHFNHLNAPWWADWMPTIPFTSTTMSYGNPRKGIEQWLYSIQMMITTVWVCCYQIYYKYFFKLFLPCWVAWVQSRSSRSYCSQLTGSQSFFCGLGSFPRQQQFRLHRQARGLQSRL